VALERTGKEHDVWVQIPEYASDFGDSSSASIRFFGQHREAPILVTHFDVLSP